MSTISTVAVDFLANTSKFIQGLNTVSKQTKAWASNTEKESKAATAAFEGTSKALNILSRQLLAVVSIQKISAAFGDVVKNASALVDEAQKVGASVDQFSALDTAARKNGASINDVKIAYKELQKSINEALAGNKDTIKSFNELGLSYSYLAKLSPDEIFLVVGEALKGVTDENKRAEIGTKLLSKSYTELVPVIQLGRQGIIDAAKESPTGQQLIELDKLNKQYEKIGQTIKLKFIDYVIQLQPELLKLADRLTFIIKNLEGLIKTAAIAFSPFLLLSFSSALLKLSTSLANFTKVQIVANTTAVFFEKTLFRLAIPTILLTGLNTLSKALGAVAVGFTAIAATAGVVVAAIGAIVGAFLLLFKAFAFGNEQFANLLEYFGASAETIKKYRDKAIYQNEIVSASIDEILKKLGFSTDETNKALKDLIDTQNRFNQATNDANVELDKEAELLKDIAKKEMELSEAIIQEMATRAKAIEDSVMTPSEVYQNEIDKVREVFQSGLISYETYQKAIAKLARDAASSTVELISTPGELVRRQILEFGRLYTEGIITLEQAQRAIQITTANAGKAVTDFIRTPIEEAKKKILDFTIAYQDGFVTIEEATAATEKVIKEMGQSIVDYLSTPADEVKKRIANIVELYQAGFITLEQSTAALAKANSELWEATNPKIMEAFGFMSSFADQFSRAIVEGQNFGDALKNVFKSILRDITALIIRTTILQGIMAAIGIIAPDSGAAAAFGRMTGLIPRAGGGNVMAGEAYMVGEKGPEAFVPSTNGVILPNDFQGGGETINFVQNISIETGVSQTVRAEMLGLLPRFKQEAMAGVLDAKQRGGSYAKGLAAA